MATINLGKVKLTPMGQYDSTRDYAELSLVGHEGSSYVSIKDVPAGIPPTNTAYWQLHGSKGADGQNGADAYQPFKGWHDTPSALTTAFPSPQVGDYAYIKGAASSDPATIYECTTAGTWTASQREFNPANNQEFASGEGLNTVRIVDNLNSSSPTDVLSAKQGKMLDAKINELGQEIGYLHMTVTYSDITMTKGAVVGSTGANATSDNFYRTPFIDIDGYSKVKFLAFIASSSTSTFGYAFYSSNDASSYISGKRCDVNTSLSGFEQKEYSLDIPSGAKYFRSCINKDFRTSFVLEASAGASLKGRVDAIEEAIEGLPELENTLDGLEDAVDELNDAVSDTETPDFTFRIGDTNINTGAPNSSSSSGCIRTGLVSIKAGTSITVDSGYQFKVSVYNASPASSSTWNSEKSRSVSSNDYVAEEDILAIIVVRKYPIVTPPSLDWAGHLHITYTQSIKQKVKAIENRVTALENQDANTDVYYHGPWGLKPSEFDKGYYICGQTQVRTDLGFTTAPNASGISECQSVYEDVIGWMDALMALTNVSNTTITKRAIGTSSDNKTLYEYIFTPKRYSSADFPTKQMPIILIDACIHGFEKNSFFAWYAFLKDMLTRTDSVQLDAIARNVEIHFVPVSNPNGFDNNSYYNANHVNLNRNFESSDWESITEGTDQSGYADNPQPFDQPESQAIRDWILTYPKAMMMFTSHTNGRVTNGYDEMNACMTRFGIAGAYFDRLADVIRKHITEQTQQIPRIYNLNIGSAFCGRYQYSESHGGTETTWVREVGNIPVMTLETFNGLRVDGSYVIGQFSNNSIKCCAEIAGNLLLQVLTEYAE